VLLRSSAFSKSVHSRLALFGLTMTFALLGVGGLAAQSASAVGDARVFVELKCSPSQVPVGQSTFCTVTVSHELANPNENLPTGKVTFSDSRGTGTFSPASNCELKQASPFSSSCEVVFSGPAGGRTIKADYPGDAVHQEGSAAAGVKVFVPGGTRFAAPGGTGADPCTNKAAPCSLFTAASLQAPGTSVVPGAEVVLKTGTYVNADLGNRPELQLESGITFRGEAGAPRPLISLESGVFGTNVNVSHVEIESKTGSTALSARSSTVDEVVARSSRANALTCAIDSGVLRDSACLSTGAGSAAAGGAVFTESGESFQPKLRNVTAISTGAESVGVRFVMESFGAKAGEFNADLGSVIAKGKKVDIEAKASAFVPVGQVHISADHSDYATIEPKNPTANLSITAPGDASNANITALPLLEADNIHQTFSSPTIDKGVVDGVFGGAIDIDGEARVQGTLPDIGADEIVPPNGTLTKLSCNPSPVFKGEAAKCTATVTDKGDNGPARELVGDTVAFQDTTQANAFTPATCTLKKDSQTQASCEVEFKSETIAKHHLEATFATDGKGHASSFGLFELEVKALPNITATELTCKAATLIKGETTKCTAIVTDTGNPNPVSLPLGGIVTFKDNTEAAAFIAPATCTLVTKNTVQAQCQAEVDFKPNTVAIHTLEASYSGDGEKHAPSVSGPVPFEVKAQTQPSTTETKVECKVVSLFKGDTTKCNAIVTDKGDNGPVTSMTGSFVSFQDSIEPGAFSAPASCKLKTINPENPNKATCETEVNFHPETVANHSVKATYLGDAAHVGSESPPITIQVKPQVNSTETKLKCKAELLTKGEATRCTAEVIDLADHEKASSLGGETVTFVDETEESAINPTTCTLAVTEVSTVASCRVEIEFKPTIVGLHSLTATFAGDDAHRGSAGEKTVRVKAPPNNTETKFECAVKSLFKGETTFCTAKVTDLGDNGDLSPPSGTVTFLDHTQNGSFAPASCQLRTLGGNVASCNAEVEFHPTITANHQIEVVFPADGAHLGSVARAEFQVKVQPNETSTELSCEAPTLVSGGATQCTAIVTDNGTPNPVSSLEDGVVSFKDITESGAFVAPATCTLEKINQNQTQASCNTKVEFKPTLVGRHELEASYLGDEGVHAKSVKVIPFQVNPQPNDTETELSCEPKAPTSGETTHCTVTVTDIGPGPASSPAGPTVTFEDSTEPEAFSPPATCVLKPKGATRAVCETEVELEPTVPGEHVLKAHYPGDGGNHADSVGTLGLEVKAAPPAPHTTKTTLVCNPATLVLGTGASQCTATVEDTAAAATHPSGEVKLELVGGDGALAAKACNLPANGQTKVSCQVVAFTPGKAGDSQLKATYLGDATHAQSNGTAKVTATAAITPPPPPPPAAPNTILGKKPPKKTGAAPAMFKFSSDQASATFTCKVDRKVAKPCTSPFKVKVRRGAHTITITAVNAQGVADPTPVVYKWTVGPVKRRPRH
jgi:carbon monoxide dehydrogenase subunit G